jgi:hypothetical protein
LPVVDLTLRVESGGIPHLAKNERDVGHPTFVTRTGSIGSTFVTPRIGPDRVQSRYPNVCYSEGLLDCERVRSQVY